MDGSKGLMLLGLTVCLFAGFLNSSPGDDNSQETPKKRKQRYSILAYNSEEKKFICSELATLGNPSTLETWIKIAEAYAINRKIGVKGFHTERTPEALRRHFFDVIVEEEMEIVPECVRVMLKDRRLDYTTEEETFIITELLAYDGTNLHNKVMWEKIKIDHDLKVDAEEKGFSGRKSMLSLRWHFYNAMLPNGRVPEAVLKKFPSASTIQQGGSSKSKGDETSQKQQTPRAAPTPYSPEEKRFICTNLAFLGNPSSMKTWKIIEQAFKIELEEGTPGFKRERKADSLRKQFFYTILEKDIAIVPECVKDMVKGRTQRPYTQEEEDHIISTLLTYEDTSLHNEEMWIQIEIEHNAYVDAGVKGFLARKSMKGLRWHFYRIMLPKGRVPQEVLEKFRKKSITQQDGSRSGSFISNMKPRRPSRQPLTEEDERNYWASVVEELRQTPTPSPVAENRKYWDYVIDELQDVPMDGILPD